jgi:hypothetical protein
MEYAQVNHFYVACLFKHRDKFRFIHITVWGSQSVACELVRYTASWLCITVSAPSL